jgi:hypothetical protein
MRSRASMNAAPMPAVTTLGSVGMTQCRHRLFRALLTLVLTLPLWSTAGCSTVAGTAVSPITGGIDLNREFYKDRSRRGEWAWAPFIFVGGAVAGPFVALYNGVRHDVTVFRDWYPYWRDFGDVFEPFGMINRRG